MNRIGATLFLVSLTLCPASAQTNAARGEELAKQGLAAFQAKNYAEAFRLCTEAVNLGNTDATIGLAQMYQEGWGVGKDYAKAVQLWGVTAHKYRASAYALANLYALGWGVAQSWQTARTLYLEACQKGHAESCSNVGFIYELGHGVPRDRPTAIRFFSQAGTLGDEQGGQVAKVLARPGTPVFRDAEEIGTYVGKVIGPAYLNGTLPDSRVPTEVAGSSHPIPNANQPAPAGGSAESLWQACRQKYLNLDHPGAVPLCLRAAEAGSAIATYQMGYFYENGDGVRQDKAKAAEWFLRAAAKGEPQAENAVGQFYEDGIGGLREDWVAAASSYEKSASHGNAKGEYNLGRAYEFGIGVACDLHQAVAWYEKSAKDGNERAGDQASWLRGNRFQFDGHHRNEQENAMFSGVWQGDLTVPVGRLFHNSAERIAYLRNESNYARSVDAEGRRLEYNRKKRDYDDCVRQNGSTSCGAAPPKPQ